MQWFRLAFSLLAIAEEVAKQIAAALDAGKHPDVIHAAIVGHIAETPTKVAAL